MLASTCVCLCVCAYIRNIYIYINNIFRKKKSENNKREKSNRKKKPYDNQNNLIDVMLFTNKLWISHLDFDPNSNCRFLFFIQVIWSWQ